MNGKNVSIFKDRAAIAHIYAVKSRISKFSDSTSILITDTIVPKPTALHKLLINSLPSILIKLSSFNNIGLNIFNIYKVYGLISIDSLTNNLSSTLINTCL